MTRIAWVQLGQILAHELDVDLANFEVLVV